MRRAALAAALAAAALAAPAGAASEQVVDAKDDSRGGIAGLEIHGARWYLTGSGAQRALAVTVTLGGAPLDHAGVTYEARAQVRGCGALDLQYSPGSASAEAEKLNQPLVGGDDAYLYVGCGRPHVVTESYVVDDPVTVRATGGTLTWTVPLTALPPQVSPGAVLHGFEVVADVAEPISGNSVSPITGQAVDSAYGDGIWRMR